ncbi:MAG TPA: wax ester/triacylglycerol synthase family O-acyltransferase [Casimicrobiaceae bacterium]
MSTTANGSLRQLTSLDAQFLAMEDERTHGHVSALGIYDPSTAPGGELTLDAVRSTIEQRLHLLPPFRWRLVRVPFDLDYPYWAEDPAFDLEFHVRELALPEPGDEAMLAEQAARIIARPLDHSRPLWELYLIHGLPDGRKAILTKLHHAAVDGASGAEIFGILFDVSPDGRDIEPPPSAGISRPLPGQVSMLGRGLAGVPRQPLRAMRSIPRALPHLDTVPTIRNVPGVASLAALSRRAVRALPRTADGGILEGRRLRAPRTTLNGRISPHRRAAFARLSLEDVKAVKNHFGVTVNDVVVTMCASALREWLSERGELPEDPLVAGVPVSVRTKAQVGTFGNRVSTMLVPIPTDEADPEARLRRAHEVLRSAKERHSAVPATVLQDFNHAVPPALFARAAKVTARVATSHPSQASINVIISNVPGSPMPLYIAGARQEAMFPLSGVLDGVGLNLTVMSYCGGLDVGVVADREIAGDLFPLAEAVGRALDELVALLPRTTKLERSSA